MSDDAGFAPPPFEPQDALVRLKRELRALGLAEREGRFERRGQAIARVALADGQLSAAAVKRPGRSPEWQPARILKSAADLRDFVAALERSLAGWNDPTD
jgi:hypothetical protein